MAGKNVEGELRLTKLRRLHEEEAIGKARIKQDIQDAYETKLTQLRFEKSIEANRALNAGASKSAIGRAIGTTNFTTVVDLLNLTAEQFKESVPTPEFEIDTQNNKFLAHWIEWDGERFEADYEYDIVWLVNHWEVNLPMTDETPYGEWANANRKRVAAFDQWDKAIKEAKENG